VSILPFWTRSLSVVTKTTRRGSSSAKPSRSTRKIGAALVTLLFGITMSVAGVTVGANAADPSALTINWEGDTSSAASFQPDRLPASPHYSEFRNLRVAVSQTTGLIDQVVRVDVSGFAGTVSSTIFAQNAMNYVQAMQCWGDNPAALDFRETCQWGGRSGSANTGLGTSVIGDNALRVSALDNNAFRPTTFDSPFRTFGGLTATGSTITGSTITGKNRLVDPDGPGGPLVAQVKNDLADALDPATTNEITSSRINADGTGSFDFETQTTSQAPQLGCGRDGHLRCWLVIVPRGTVFGGNGTECSSIQDPDNGFRPYDKGQSPAFQGGSPINPKCDYWDNRIVVPLDFVKVAAACEVGSSETRVIGSELMIAAMSSWQPELCRNLKATYSFSTNSDTVARAQMLDGRAPVAFTGLPISSGELETDQDRATLVKTTVAYAPVAISGAVIAFNAELSNGRQVDMKLSPRIMAKIFTQSYRFLVPSSSSDPAKNVAHLPAINQSLLFLFQDPEFQALNPGNASQFLVNPAIALPGPGGADAIRQVWRWIQADADAVSFLDGNPDPISGMSVNPYYLPKGHPNAVVPTFTEAGEFARDPNGAVIMRAVGLTNIDGSPRKLSTTPLNTFSKDDESKVPLKLNGERSRFDTLQFSPYADTLLGGAQQAFRANTRARTQWDPNRVNAAGEIGDWVSGGPQQPGQKFLITITDSASAIRYGLSVASLQLPDSREFVAPNSATFAAALNALAPTSLDAVRQVDPALVRSGGYPLTMVTYALVNLTKSTPASRASVTSMLAQVTTSGQVSGSATGQLPAGYLPLTAALSEQSAQAIATVRNYAPPSTSTARPNAPPQFAANSSDGFEQSVVDGAQATGVDPTATAGVDQLSDKRTPTAAASPLENSAVLVALLIGVAGLILAPILFRGGRLL